MNFANAQSRPEFHLRVVKEISEIINQSEGIDRILGAVADHLAVSLQFDVVSVYLWDPNSQELVMRGNHGLHFDPAHPIHLRPEEGLTGLVYEEKRPFSVVPASSHPRYKYFPDSGEWQFESYLGVPILLRRRCLGVLVAQLRREQEIHPSCETLLEIIAHRLAGVLEVAGRLEKLERPESGPGAGGPYRQGMGVSPGIAFGPVHRIRGLFDSLDTTALAPEALEQERSRLAEAWSVAERDLAALVRYLGNDGKLSSAEVAIFRAQEQILADPSVREAIHACMGDGICAEAAVQSGVGLLVRQFGDKAPAFFRERLNDLRDIGERLLGALLAGRGVATEVSAAPATGSILLAHELGPARLLGLAESGIAGIIAEVGGEGGHMAIIARSLGIPAVTGIHGLETLVVDGDRLLVDGRTGFVFVNPSEPLIKEYDGYRRKQNEIRRSLQEQGMDLVGCPFPVRVTANIGFPGDIESARRARLDDVGLFRTEFSFMQRTEWPTVDEQVAIYEDVARNFDGYMTIRTLDIGSDKQLPYFEMPREDNPMLGLRSIRFSMENREFFTQQIQAVVRTMQAGYPVRILLPMVTQLWEVESAREILEDACNEVGLHVNERPSLGIMVEVPGVLWLLQDLLERVDFVSLGTNDLVQYLLTVDRNSSYVGHLYCEHHPIVVRFLEDVVQKVRAAGKDLTVCGEMAGSPVGLLILLALGYRKFSVLPERAYLVRYICQRVTEPMLLRIRQSILAEIRDSVVLTTLNKELEAINPDLLLMD